MSKRLEWSSVDLRRDMGIEKMVNLMGQAAGEPGINVAYG